MSFLQKLKNENVSIHIVATGAGVGFQETLWSEPGCSAYLSGASFPYSPEEQEEFLGFMPEHFCSEEAAVDLASAAYMKAYRFGGKKPVGIGITASVASEKVHRGDHRIFGCIMTDDKVISYSLILEKGVGFNKRVQDGMQADNVGLILLNEAFDLRYASEPGLYKNATELAQARFFQRPLFTSESKRYPITALGVDSNMALMPGGFNPPHEGHYGLARHFEQKIGKRVVFEVVDNPPHKVALPVQELLKRAKMLRGDFVIFTHNNKYIEKARAFPNTPIILGADAMLRILDPKWGKPIEPLLKEFAELGTTFYVCDRLVDGQLICLHDIVATLSDNNAIRLETLSQRIKGRWDISSTEIRNKLA
jgi:hypothetical protein